jgi:shikimate kinase
MKTKVNGNAIKAKSNIALIGFMSTGKTSVGRLLSERLSKEFVETDSMVIRMAGKSIGRIFDEDGELRFRELEMLAVEKASRMKDVVISCGGGAVLNKLNIDRLRDSSRVVLLTASKAVILERAKKEKVARPVLNKARKASNIDELIAFRKPLYEAYADFAVDTTTISIDEAVRQVLKRL